MKQRPFFVPVMAAAGLLFLHAADAAPGAVEAGFNPDIGTVGGLIYGVALQPDGKVVLAGGLTTVGGVSRSRAARLHPSGALDTAFNPNSTGATRNACILPDGRIVYVGEFSAMGGTGRNRIARISAGGSLDTAYNPNANDWIYSTALQPDGRLVISGVFTAIGGVTRNYVARLSAEGVLESAFNPNPNGVVRSVTLQEDGKILISGFFPMVGTTARNYIARLNADGTLDTAFNPNVAGGTALYCMAPQPDGRIVIGGPFTSVGGVERNGLARIHANGTLDTAFDPGAANGNVRCLVLQTDGKIIFSGDFTSVGESVRNRIARLHPDGTLDDAFNPNADDVVYSVVVQADGKLVVGGNFHNIGGQTRNALARLDNSPATQTLTVMGTRRIQWMRGGTSPETTLVTFELSTNGGGSWSALGAATRIQGGWERNNLTLPTLGQIRARARTTSGQHNGSSGFVETVTSYSFTPLQLWRQSFFNTVDDFGEAANQADADRDGLENLVEYAFGLHPLVADATALPVWQKDDDSYVLTFSRPAGVTGITYVPEYSTNMEPGSWAAAVNSGTASNPVFAAPAVGSRLYLRVRVTVP